MYYKEIKYAIILGQDILNIIICDNDKTADTIAKSINKDAFAVNCTYKSVSSNFKYIDGTFYTKDENGNDIEAKDIKSEDDRLLDMDNKISILNDCINANKAMSILKEV